jgi:hypothetical protein
MGSLGSGYGDQGHKAAPEGRPPVMMPAMIPVMMPAFHSMPAMIPVMMPAFHSVMSRGRIGLMAALAAPQ